MLVLVGDGVLPATACSRPAFTPVHLGTAPTDREGWRGPAGKAVCNHVLKPVLTRAARHK